MEKSQTVLNPEAFKSKVPPRALAALGNIAARAGERITVASIAEQTGMSSGTTMRAIQDLRELGYLETKRCFSYTEYIPTEKALA